MDILYKNLTNLPYIRKIVKDKDSEYFKHTEIKNREIGDETVTIVMTSHNRSRQVYFTLDTINESQHKDIQLVIVDDSTIDPINIERLKMYPFYIDFIQVITENKLWINPCINYNIGFEYIKGNKIIIQNGEVCHVGDIVSYFSKNIEENMYMVFDVNASRNMYINELIYNVGVKNLTTEIYKENIWVMWYQHTIHRNEMYHFLTGLTRESFKKIEEFSYDYCFSTSWDDNDLLLKIMLEKLRVRLISNEKEGIGGIHLCHTGHTPIHQNEHLYYKKRNYCKLNNSYMEISKALDYNELINRYNKLNNIPI